MFIGGIRTYPFRAAKPEHAPVEPDDNPKKCDQENEFHGQNLGNLSAKRKGCAGKASMILSRRVGRCRGGGGRDGAWRDAAIDICGDMGINRRKPERE